MKVIYLPLDERPCNYDFPYKIFNSKDFTVIRPPMEIMGYKKKAADMDSLNKWLVDNSSSVDGLVLSIDTLVYGGIVPSRIHSNNFDELIERLKVIEDIKKKNPKLLIYAFQLIMRSPQYNSSDEEPDYYQYHGRNIFRFGYLKHLEELKLLSESNKVELNSIEIPKDVLDDFLNRRSINAMVNSETLRLVADGVIDFLSIPQDDSAQYGWTAIDQDKIRKVIKTKALQTKVFMYPGADEAGCTVMSRMFCKINGITPKVYIKYPGVTSPTVVPSLEDRYMDTMVKYQVITSGGIIVESLKEADSVLFINTPADRMLSSFFKTKPGPGMNVLRNVVEAIEFIKYARSINKAIIIGDVTYGNGSDKEINDLLEAGGLLFEIAGFGGWNTAANSIGSSIAQGFNYLKHGKTKEHLDFLMSRYIEDIGYCGYVRQIIMKDVLPNSKYNYFNVEETDGEIARIVLSELGKFLKEEMKGIFDASKINSLKMPWRRMYEIDLDAEYNGKL
jgi:hypothetical protein